MATRTTQLSPVIVAAGALLFAPLAFAGTDSGFYVGAGIGSATIEDDVPEVDDFDFDENDNAWKIFGGYNFGLIPLIDLAVEAGYVDLGGPDDTIGGTPIGIELDGFNAFGLAGLNFGPFGAFAKAGLIRWDSEGNVGGVAFDDDGTDLAWGIGGRFTIASFQIRAEYELYDVDDVDDVYMVSASLVYTF